MTWAASWKCGMLRQPRVPRAGGDDARRSAAGEPRDQVDRVDGDVVDRPAVLARLEVPRRPLAEHQRVLGGESDGVDVADRAVADEPAHRAEHGRVAQVEQAADRAALSPPQGGRC